jgi:predicted Zn-dependent protease
MNRSGCEELFARVADAARALGVRDVEAIISGGDHALTRFANNAIHQNVFERAVYLSVRPVIDGRTARATTNRLDGPGIRAVVEEAVAIARLTAPDPDLPPLAEPAQSGDADA